MICVIFHPQILRSLGPLGPLGPLLLWWFQKLLFITASQCDPRWPMAPNRGCENAVQTKVGSQTGQSPGWKSVEIGGENLWKSDFKSVAFLKRLSVVWSHPDQGQICWSKQENHIHCGFLIAFFLDPIQTCLAAMAWPALAPVSSTGEMLPLNSFEIVCVCMIIMR